MIDVKPSFQKFVSVKLSLKYFLLGIILLVIVVGLSVKILYFTHSTSAVPNKPGSSTNMALNNKGSESVDQLSPSITSTGPIKVVYELPVNQPVVYITIDDGWYPNQEVLKLMQQYHLPITTYLVEQAAQKHPDYWHEFVNDGGRIEDHTFNHPFLTHLSLADQINQISQPIDYFRQYGPPPDELRPPYGDFNSVVGQAAKDSMIKYIVMWDAEIKNSKLSTRSGLGLKSGDIILLHWEPGLDQELLKLLSIIQKQNLGIADLSQALNGEPLTICWLKTPIPVSEPTSTITTKTRVAGTSGKTVTSVDTGTSRSK
ncbi:MAG: polysaccharide deacetylase family protein [Desulfosporosinus sp.]|nr:polysaccharide deacetylase family protein [Desulfosporosinus sp.]